MREEDLADFVSCYKPGALHERQETYGEENPDGRWRKFAIDDVFARDKTSLDITWIKTGEDISEVPLSGLLGEIREKSDNIASAVAELEKLLGVLKND